MGIFLGIDPGSKVTGYGLIHCQKQQIERVASGVIRTKGGTTGEKLLEIFEGLERVVCDYRPVEAAIEKVFVHHNPAGALTLGQARGVAILSLSKYAISIAEYAARQIKQAVVGYGAAEKAQVMQMVRLQLNYQDSFVQDEADALACALCHIRTRNSLNMLVTQVQGSRTKARYQRYEKGRIK